MSVRLGRWTEGSGEVAVTRTGCSTAVSVAQIDRSFRSESVPSSRVLRETGA